MTTITLSLRVTAPGPAVARVSVGRRHSSIGRPVEFDDASPHVAALEYALGAVGGEVVNGLREFARRRRLAIDAVDAFYANKEALAEDAVSLLRAELDELRSAGAEFVQFDEPVLTEVAFAPGRTRTLMCAALAARKDPAEELEFAVSLINEVVAGIDDLRLGLHVYCGNWSRDETTLLSGGYQALRPYLDRLEITQLVLEYATDRAGALVAFERKELGLGVVNPRTEPVETPAEIRRAVEEAVDLYPAERVFLNPDCGFGTFSNRPMNTRETASAKVAAMAAAARDLRGEGA